MWDACLFTSAHLRPLANVKAVAAVVLADSGMNFCTRLAHYNHRISASAAADTVPCQRNNELRTRAQRSPVDGASGKPYPSMYRVPASQSTSLAGGYCNASRSSDRFAYSGTRIEREQLIKPALDGCN
jgi:hypothetical protein